MKQLSVIAAGDVCMRDMWEKMDEAFGRRVLRRIQPVLDSADVRLVNLENPLLEGGKPIAKSGPALKGLPQNIGFIQAGNFDCAILANNHIGDYGDEGVLDTLELLERKQLAHVGGGKNIEEAYAPWFVEKNGMTLAVIAAGENEFGVAGDHKPGMAGLQMGRLLALIEQAKEKADFVLVVIHGGNEENPLPSPRVVERYRMIADFGADAVIGMHTHCPQGYETYHGVPIVYSTGNFFFNNKNKQQENSPWYYGYLPKITFQEEGPAALEIIPFRFDPACTEITPFTGEKKEKMLAYLQKISDLFQDPARHADYFKGWCMITGPIYADMMHFYPRFLENEASAGESEFLNMRNLFTCEAHNELMYGLLLVIENHEVAFAQKMAEKVEKLQIMPV